MLLVLSDAFDAHADRVLHELAILGEVAYFRLNLDVQSLELTSLRFPGESEQWILSQSGRQVSLADIEAVWLRRASIERSALDDRALGTDPATVQLWLGEWGRVLAWLFQSLDKKAWFPPLRESLRAENKLLQLRAARSAGLKVPETLVTNERAAAIEFARKAPVGLALKSLAQDFYAVGDTMMGLYVNRVGAEDLLAMADCGEAPLFLQAYVPKRYEVRVTTVAGNHLACRIDSQASDVTASDWRRYDLPRTPHTAIKLPEEVSAGLDHVLEVLGLPFGASDFIVTPDGDWYFLEVNPNGQWLWIEQLTGLPIARHIALALVSMCARV